MRSACRFAEPVELQHLCRVGQMLRHESGVNFLCYLDVGVSEELRDALDGLTGGEHLDLDGVPDLMGSGADHALAAHGGVF